MIVLIRHGETEWNCEGRKQGRGDSDLTAKGRNQAKLIGIALLNSGILSNEFRIICSPLGRTRTTAELICDQANIAKSKIEFDDVLMESDHGDWEGKTIDEIEKEYPGAISKRLKDQWNVRFPRGESYGDLECRIQGWLDGINKDETTIVITHDMISRVIRKVYLGCSVNQCLAFRHSQNTYYTLYNFEACQHQVQ